MKPLLFIFAALLLSSSCLFAHGGKKHKKDSVKSPVDSVMSVTKQPEHIAGDTVHHHDSAMEHDESKVSASFNDFPTLHPIIVHFAIVLIILAAVLQLLNIYLMKTEVSWIIAGILLVGVAAAWFASKNFHPHTHGLSEHAELVLAQHDKWADLTVYFGFTALLLQIVNLFVFKSKRWASALVAIVLAMSAYSVAHAGHYGAQLVHIEGIGPQGKYLEMEHQH